jgi:predicted ATPase
MERELPVPPFETGDFTRDQPLQELARHEAVRLFVDRAQAVRPDFALTPTTAPAVCEICARLDGLPLAIELAAVLMKFLPPAALLEQLRERLALPSIGGLDLPARQRTLEAAVKWSYDLLGESECALFRGLSLFAGGWTLEAAHAVCMPSENAAEVSKALFRLVDKSLVLREDAGDEPRFRMLQTVRECAQELLERSGEAQNARKRFASWCVELAELAEPMLYGPEQSTWLKRLDAEYANLAAALGRLQAEERRGDGLQLAAALGWYWFRRARYSEGDHWLSAYRSLATEEDPAELRARLAYSHGWLKTAGFEVLRESKALACFQESLQFFREADKKTGIALCLAHLVGETTKSEFSREKGVTFHPTRETSLLADECLVIARESGDPWVLSYCLNTFGFLGENVDVQIAHYKESIALARTTGDPFLLSKVILGMADYHGLRGDHEAMKRWGQESLSISRKSSDKISLLTSLHSLAVSHVFLGSFSTAKPLIREALRLAVDVGARMAFQYLVGIFDLIARGQGKMREAARFWGAACSFSDIRIGSDEEAHMMSTVLGLDEDTVRAEYEAGYSMTLEQIMAYAESEDW